MKGARGSRGYVKLIITLLLVAGIGFIGITFAKPYYRFITLRSHTKDILTSELGSVELIRKGIMEEAADLNVPLEPENLEVHLNTRTKVITVKATWSEVVDLWGYYQKQIDFDMETDY
jgi:hypothetical protein